MHGFTLQATLESLTAAKAEMEVSLEQSASDALAAADAFEDFQEKGATREKLAGEQYTGMMEVQEKKYGCVAI